MNFDVSPRLQGGPKVTNWQLFRGLVDQYQPVRAALPSNSVLRFQVEKDVLTPGHPILAGQAEIVKADKSGQTLIIVAILSLVIPCPGGHIDEHIRQTILASKDIGICQDNVDLAELLVGSPPSYAKRIL